MNAPPEQHCRAYRDALVLLACGDVALDDLTASVAAHLAICSACRAELAESRRTAESLADAMSAEPLSPALHRRIMSAAESAGAGATQHLRLAGTEARSTEGWELAGTEARSTENRELAGTEARSTENRRLSREGGTRVPHRRTRKGGWAQGAGFAAAAALLLGCLLPWNGTNPVVRADRLTEADQLDLLAAYASLQWDGPVEYSIERVSDVLSDVSGRLEALADELDALPSEPVETEPFDGARDSPPESLRALSSPGTAICAAPRATPAFLLEQRQ